MPSDENAITRIGDTGLLICPSCKKSLQSEYTVCPYDGTPLADKYATGNKISGKYEILGQIGAGGMGIVYKVRQTLVNRIMALKRMHGKSLSEEGLIRFQQEAKASFRLHHQNIVSVHDFDFYDGDPYLVMEFVDGKPLSRMIQEQVRLPLDTTLEIAIQLCDALAHAHESGILHRDLKPANIMIVSAGATDQKQFIPKILDFGIAKSIDTVSGDTQQLTKTGQAVGSPLYMSPEQCEGKKVDQRSDIYSLGCVVYECLTSLPPLQRETVLGTMMAHIHEKPLSLKEASLGTEYPSEIESIVTRLLEKNPESRYQTMREVEGDLLKLKRGSRLALVVSNSTEERTKTQVSSKLVAWSSLLIACSFGLAIFAWNYLVAVHPHVDSKVPGTSAAHSEEDNPSISKTDKLIGYLIDTGKLSDPVDFSGSDITDDGIRILSTVKSIHKLNVSNTSVTDRGVRYLAGLSNINVLDLSNTKISDASADSIGRLKGLEALFVANNKVGSKLVSALKSLPVLLELDLRNTNISDQDLVSLPTQAKVLKELDIGTNQISDFGIRQCGKLQYLMNLDVSGTGVSDVAMQSLANNHELTTLDLSNTKITGTGLSTLLSGCRIIHSLYLNHDDITDGSIGDIAAQKNLEHLDVRNTLVSDTGLLKLAQCKTLMDVALQGSAVSPTGVDKFKKLCPSVDIVEGYALNHLVLWLPSDKVSSGSTIDVHLALAKHLLGVQKYNESIIECNKALLLHDTKERQNEPGFEQANQIKAECLVKLGRKSEAIKEANRLHRIGELEAAAAIRKVLEAQ